MIIWYKTWHKKYAIMFHIYTNICIYFNDFIFTWKYYSVYVLLILFFFLLHKMSSVMCYQMTEFLITEQIIKKIVIVSKVILIFISKSGNYSCKVDQMFIFFPHFHRSTFVNVKITRIKCNRFCYTKQNYF